MQVQMAAKGGKKGKGKLVVDEGESEPISKEEAKSAAQQVPSKKKNQNKKQP